MTEKTVHSSETDELRAHQELSMDSIQTETFSRYTGPYIAGRVAARHRTAFDVITENRKFRVKTSGALLKIGKIPAVGDFVVILNQPETGTRMIVDILPRRSILTRGAAGEGNTEQVIAANLDIVFIVTAAGSDFNPRRLERYLTIVHASGAKPVIVINKSDLAEDAEKIAAEAVKIAGKVPVVTISALKKNGLEELENYLMPEKTVALVGSSGVGKSTIINALLSEEVQDTFDTRKYDEKGRHTTTVRQLFTLPGGAVIIDNPGVREIQIGSAAAGIDETFPEIAEFAPECRYRNCRHTDEPGCAVIEAVNAGFIPKERLESYHRLMKESEFQAEKEEIGLKRIEKKKYKWIGKAAKRIHEDKERCR
ncbi:ribosome small subunit-dependent GTPase A [Methanoplanus limicola]|uniref:Ribosome biogenesis GTPase RsgA n=1 Tax=Methanoplanus limicola DSM 2279 TaxID=937775 RepID=H1Z1D1_9EURY|nr:ribosome small subunit-dependent GTPase A [Methanoplanus limicola]EHQ36278.1 ribosome biogenesis GTPase RsgA [Methanoplanus limicola DSM 2279]